MGAYPPPAGASEVLGVEFSGVVVEIPEGIVKGAGKKHGEGKEEGGEKAGKDGDGKVVFRVGDEVMGLAYGGTSSPLHPHPSSGVLC